MAFRRKSWAKPSHRRTETIRLQNLGWMVATMEAFSAIFATAPADTSRANAPIAAGAVGRTAQRATARRAPNVVTAGETESPTAAAGWSSRKNRAASAFPRGSTGHPISTLCPYALELGDSPSE